MAGIAMITDKRAVQLDYREFGRRRFLLAAALSCAGVFCAWATMTSAGDEPGSAAAGSVQLVVDYNDGVEKRFSRIPWKKGLTVLEVLQFAKKHPHGISFHSSGSGATYFVSAIDGMKNQGGGDGQKNWIYSVNGKKGVKSCAVCELASGDVVQWKYDDAQL